MTDKTEWDIKNGNFNKPVDFPETINEPYEPIRTLTGDSSVSEKELKEITDAIDQPFVLKKKSKRIDPDALPVLYTAVALVSVLMIASFVVSFSGIYEVSAWTGLPEILQWLPAFFIDAAILAYTISLVVFKARGESTWRTLLGLTGFALMSVVANVAHTLNYWNGSITDYRGWIGVAITAAAPIAVLLASEEITRLAFEKE